VSEIDFEWLDTPSITAPAGWLADGVYAGIKTYGAEPRCDVGVLLSEREATVGGIFTTNRVCGAPVTVNRGRVAAGVARGLVANSGCSNVAMGERGIRDAEEMARLAASHCGIREHQMLVASTGVIARPLPMEKLAQALPTTRPSKAGGDAFSRAIMTTDTVKKNRALRFSIGGRSYTVAGTAKGAGMAHPNMATVFCFLTTDAAVGPKALQALTKSIGDRTINMVDVDMDTSTSDMMLMFANGASGGPDLANDSKALNQFEVAAHEVCLALAKDLARDGEGAKTLIECVVQGARSEADARIAARTVVSSPLIKTMITGRDPNLGRVMMALGRSGADIDVDKLSVWIGRHCAFQGGTPTALELSVISKEMAAPDVQLRVDLGLGTGSATAWGCDFTEEYVRINAHYTT
jgi:glutamate N-acetyltransferase / amino-acid N-acetyltransferase